MSHDANNKDCHLNKPHIVEAHRFDGLPIACTCPPAVDGVEQIRALNRDYPLQGKYDLYKAITTLLRIVDQLRAELAAKDAEIERLLNIMRDAYEVYAGSEWSVPETAPEAYYQQLIKQMADALNWMNP